MPPPKKKKLDDKEQTSLFSFVSDKKQKKAKASETQKITRKESPSKKFVWKVKL